nr:zinc ribbon domain-containing protein [Clostridium estertheticum]
MCGACGSTFGRKVWNSTDERLRRVVWRCNKKYEVKGKKGCGNKHIDDKILYQAFINTFNVIIENKAYFMEKWKAESQSGNLLRRYKADEFIKMIADGEPIKEFDIDIYFKIIEKMIVFEGNKIIVTLLEGTEVEVVIE